MAQEQLKILSEKINLSFYTTNEKNPENIAKNALKYAKKENFSILLIDTSGRLEVDKDSMLELKNLNNIVNPSYSFFVVDSMAGQNVFEIFKVFNMLIKIDSLILSKFDSDAKGGIALSVKYILNKPISFIGTGERIENLNLFHPERFIKKILGYGDIETLVEKIEENVSQEETKNIKEKLLSNTFSLNDYLMQIQKIKNMGKISNLLSMLPSSNLLATKKLNDKDLLHQEAILLSMTKRERKNHLLLNNISRKKRIAKGSGRNIQEVKKVINQFLSMQKIFKKIKSNPSLLEKLNIFN